MKMVYLVVLVLVLISVPVYAEWKLVYETDFSSDPGWETNNLGNYYWDSKEENYFLKVVPGSESYATKKIPWNNNGFKINFDLKIMSVQSYGNINFGLMDDKRNHKGPNVTYVLYGIDIDRHIQFRAILSDPTNPYVRGVRPYDYGSGFSYHHEMKYQNSTGTAILEIWKQGTNGLIANMSIKDIQFKKMENLGTSIIGFSGGQPSIAHLDNVKYYVWEEYGTELFVNITGVAQAADGLDVVMDFYVEHEGSGVENLTDAEIFVDGQELAARSPKNKGDGFYNVSFALPKLVGNLNITLRALYDEKTAEASAVFLHKIKHGKKVLIITGGDFWDSLYASALGYPVLRQEDKKQIDYFAERYKPDNIFTIGFEEKNYVVNDRNFLAEQFPGSGHIAIDTDRKKSLLAGSIAALIDYRLTNKTDISGNVICAFSCNITNAVVLDTEEKLENYLISLQEKTDYIVLANINSNISGFSPRLVTKRDGILLPFSYHQKNLTANDSLPISSEIRALIEKLMDNNKLSEDFYFSPVIYLAVLGMPYGLVDDPAHEFYNNIDGEMLYTDNFYGNIDEDPYQDAAVGRITSPIQIENIDFWDSTQKDGMIVAEYRTPKMIDLIIPGGMTEGFITERALSSYDFDFKRIVEIRGTKLEVNAISMITEKYGVWDFAKDYWFKYALDMLKPTSMLKLGSELKYSLLEYDWVQTFRKMRPLRLPKISKTEILKELPGEGIIFFFGIGNQTEWVMPKSVLNPYPDSAPKLNAKDINFKEPVFFFDEHSLSGHPDSKFTESNNLVLVGSTGIIHSPNAAMALLAFLAGITNNKPIGEALMNSKNIVVFSEKNETMENLMTGSVTTSALLKMQKEHYQKILYGDPKILLDPVPGYDNTNYKVSDDMKINIIVDFTYEIEDGAIEFEDYDILLMEYNKPVVPLKKLSIPLPGNSNILSINKNEFWKKYNNISIPILEPDEYYEKEPFLDKFPNETIWAGVDEKIDGRKALELFIIPVIYYNNSSADVLEKIEFEIAYEAPAEILDINVETFFNTANFNIRTKAHGNNKIFIKVDNVTIQKDIFIHGIENITFNWRGAAGKHTAEFVIVGEEVTGPKSLNFELNDFLGTIKNTSSKDYIQYEIRTFENSLKLTIRNSTIIRRYYEPHLFLENKISPNHENKALLTTFGYLSVFANSTIVKSIFITPNGSYEKTIENGLVNEHFTGDQALLKIYYENALSYMELAERRANLMIKLLPLAS